jgi:hypothetical protein
MGVKKGHGHFLTVCQRKIKRERRQLDGWQFIGGTGMAEQLFDKSAVNCSARFDKGRGWHGVDVFGLESSMQTSSAPLCTGFVLPLHFS